MFKTRSVMSLLFGLAVLCGAAVSASAAERLVQSTTEARTIVYFKADNDAVQKLLPAGWVSTPGTGPSRTRILSSP
jgi:hypothetical protein